MTWLHSNHSVITEISYTNRSHKHEEGNDWINTSIEKSLRRDSFWMIETSSLAKLKYIKRFKAALSKQYLLILTININCD